MVPLPQKGRLLIVDDEPELVVALCGTLEMKGFQTSGFTDPLAALDAIRTCEYDLLLLDLQMPGMNGIQLLRQALALNPHLVGIMMTGHGSIQVAVEAMQAGATDFVLKPFRMSHVLTVLDRALGLQRMQAENVRLRQEVERLEAERVRVLEETNARLLAWATTDALTGLVNRRAFEEVLTRETALVDRIDRPVSLILCDIDHFKGFNDTFGHPAGDEVLRQVASTIRGCCRTSDVAARIGGEELAVLLPGTETEGALTLAERIRSAIAEGPWHLHPVTVSVGVATMGPKDGMVAPPLYEAADRALYQAKRDGRNQVVVFSSDLTQ